MTGLIVWRTDGGYAPAAWMVCDVAARPWVKGIAKNKQSEFVIDGNIYVCMLQHIYIVEKG